MEKSDIAKCEKARETLLMEERKKGRVEGAESKLKFSLCTRYLMQLSCGKGDRHEVGMGWRKQIVLIKAVVEQGLCSRRVKPDLQELSCRRVKSWLKRKVDEELDPW